MAMVSYRANLMQMFSSNVIAILGEGFHNLKGGLQIEYVINMGGNGPQTQEVIAF
jgi:cold shock CspA family protein